MRHTILHFLLEFLEGRLDFVKALGSALCARGSNLGHGIVMAVVRV